MSVVDRRLDLGSMTDDAGVGEKALDAARVEAGHRLDIDRPHTTSNRDTRFVGDGAAL